MRLKFIGITGIMGLEHGEVYNVTIKNGFGETNIEVAWWNGTSICHRLYSSPALFAKEWAKPGRKVKVKKKERAVWKWFYENGVGAYRCSKCLGISGFPVDTCPHCGVGTRGSYREVSRYMRAGLLPPLSNGGKK